MPPITMLVVDDNEHFRYLAAHAAQINGRVEMIGEAEQGVDAISMCLAHHPDIVLLDLHMPAMDGLEAIQGIRGVSPDSRILTWSGYDHAFGEDAVALGADDHVSKAMPISEVIDRVVELAGEQPQVATTDDHWIGAFVVHSLTRKEAGQQIA